MEDGAGFAVHVVHEVALAEGVGGGEAGFAAAHFGDLLDEVDQTVVGGEYEGIDEDALAFAAADFFEGAGNDEGVEAEGLAVDAARRVGGMPTEVVNRVRAGPSGSRPSQPVRPSGGARGGRTEPAGQCDPSYWNSSRNLSRVVSAGAPESGEYFSRLLRSGQVWGSEIDGDTELSGEVGRNVWRL